MGETSCLDFHFIRRLLVFLIGGEGIGGIIVLNAVTIIILYMKCLLVMNARAHLFFFLVSPNWDAISNIHVIYNPPFEIIPPCLFLVLFCFLGKP